MGRIPKNKGKVNAVSGLQPPATSHQSPATSLLSAGGTSGFWDISQGKFITSLR